MSLNYNFSAYQFFETANEQHVLRILEEDAVLDEDEFERVWYFIEKKNRIGNPIANSFRIEKLKK